jgi:hypothetical protein
MRLGTSDRAVSLVPAAVAEVAEVAAAMLRATAAVDANTPLTLVLNLPAAGSGRPVAASTLLTMRTLRIEAPSCRANTGAPGFTLTGGLHRTTECAGTIPLGRKPAHQKLIILGVRRAETLRFL